MKHLSYILALWVLLLSTVPCFLEDKCLFQCANEQTEEPCADNDGSSCTGCPIPKLFHSPTAELILLNNNLSFYKEKMIPHFSSSIWQPPKLMNLADFCMS